MFKCAESSLETECFRHACFIPEFRNHLGIPEFRVTWAFCWALNLPYYTRFSRDTVWHGKEVTRLLIFGDTSWTVTVERESISTKRCTALSLYLIWNILGISTQDPDCAFGTALSQQCIVIFRRYVTVAMSYGDVTCSYGNVASYVGMSPA